MNELNDRQARSALAYDQSQGFSKDEIKTIQEVVGVPADGQLGLGTVRSIATWQRAHGVPADGMVKKDMRGNTWPRILQAYSAAHGGDARYRALSQIRLGVWCDNGPGDGPGDATRPDFAVRMADLGIEHVTLIANQESATWALRWSEVDFKKVAQSLRAKGIEVGLMLWPYPSKAQLSAMEAALPGLIGATGAAALQLDVEGNWREEHLAGYPNLDAARTELIRVVQGAARSVTPNLRLELSGVPTGPDFGASATISPQMDVIIPEAYSRYAGGDAAHAWGAAYGPGNEQKRALERAEKVPGRHRIACGLAAWDQAFPGHAWADVMREALRGAVDGGAWDIRYWSSKFLYGPEQQEGSVAFLRDTAAFLRELRQHARGTKRTE